MKFFLISRLFDYILAFKFEKKSVLNTGNITFLTFFSPFDYIFTVCLFDIIFLRNNYIKSLFSSPTNIIEPDFHYDNSARVYIEVYVLISGTKSINFGQFLGWGTLYLAYRNGHSSFSLYNITTIFEL